MTLLLLLKLRQSEAGRYPLLVQADGSDDGRETAAQFAEAIFSPHLNVAAAKAYYDDVKGRIAKYGRDPDHCKILPGLSVIVRPTTVALPLLQNS